MLVPVKCHIRMNLIADYQNVVGMAETSQFLQSFLVPNQTCRIMWIAQDEQLARCVTNAFQLFEIHCVRAVLLFNQRIEYHFVTVVFRYQAEGMVNRRLNDHLVPLLQETVHHQTDAFHNAGNV